MTELEPEGKGSKLHAIISALASEAQKYRAYWKAKLGLSTKQLLGLKNNFEVVVQISDLG